MHDPHNLQRFVDAQEGVYPQVLKELMAARKQSHWMWFIFPQLAGLGRTAMSQRYAIRTLDEARAYADHPVLGPRLTESTRLVIASQNQSIEDIFGFPDYLKFRSSMTLFSLACRDTPLFQEAIARFFYGEGDLRTTDLLSGAARPEHRSSS